MHTLKKLKHAIENVETVSYTHLPYEKVKGSANELYEKWVKICMDSLENAKLSTFSKNIKNIIRDFDNLELLDIKKPRVGLVGEILVKFLSLIHIF